jgi:hypothetical protein
MQADLRLFNTHKPRSGRMKKRCEQRKKLQRSVRHSNGGQHLLKTGLPQECAGQSLADIHLNVIEALAKAAQIALDSIMGTKKIQVKKYQGQVIAAVQKSVFRYGGRGPISRRRLRTRLEFTKDLYSGQLFSHLRDWCFIRRILILRKKRLGRRKIERSSVQIDSAILTFSVGVCQPLVQNDEPVRIFREFQPVGYLVNLVTRYLTVRSKLQLALDLGYGRWDRTSQPKPLPDAASAENRAREPCRCRLQQADSFDKVAFPNPIRADEHV